MARLPQFKLLLTGTIAATLAFSLSGCGSLPKVSTFQADAHHSGVYSGEGVPELEKLKWKYKIGAPVVASPVVAEQTIYIGGHDHYLHAINAADGQVKWKFKTEGKIDAAVTVT